MKNLKKIIQAATIATVLLGTAQISYGQLYGQLASGQLACGKETILAGFKFKRDCQSGKSKFSITNTYDDIRNLTIDGNFYIKNGSAYYDDTNGSVSVINFPPRKDIGFNKDLGNRSAFKFRINSKSYNGRKPIKSISISCNSSTKKIAGAIITPICSGQTPRFFVENVSGNKSVAYQGVRGNLKIKNFKVLSSGEQHKFDLSIISKPNSSSSQAYTFMIY